MRQAIKILGLALLCLPMKLKAQEVCGVLIASGDAIVVTIDGKVDTFYAKPGDTPLRFSFAGLLNGLAAAPAGAATEDEAALLAANASETRYDTAYLHDTVWMEGPMVDNTFIQDSIAEAEALLEEEMMNEMERDRADFGDVMRTVGTVALVGLGIALSPVAIAGGVIYFSLRFALKGLIAFGKILLRPFQKCDCEQQAREAKEAAEEADEAQAARTAKAAPKHRAKPKRRRRGMRSKRRRPQRIKRSRVRRGRSQRPKRERRKRRGPACITVK